MTCRICELHADYVSDLATMVGPLLDAAFLALQEKRELTDAQAMACLIATDPALVTFRTEVVDGKREQVVARSKTAFRVELNNGAVSIVCSGRRGP